MNGWQQVTTGVEFNCQQPRRALHHVLYLILTLLPPGEWED